MLVDGNLPAVLQVLIFLAAAMLAGVLVLVSLYGFARKKSWAKVTFAALTGEVGLYVLLLAGFSIFSRQRILTRGEEKYFCEIDCHLAYSIADARWIGAGPGRKLEVTVRTRFDANTISPRRPKDAPLSPNPRNVVLLDGAGHSWAPSKIEGTPLTQGLIPGESYTTTLIFPVPQEASDLRLSITSEGGPLPLLIGNEMSVGHKKTYLRL
ncbi:MAG: hypothetical protein ACM3JB_19945 [Acidobacteriaceae bacterium]